MPVTLFWFRRDLRLTDNTGLFHALNSGFPVLAIFIFDPEILGKLNNKSDLRVSFIFDQLQKLKLELEKIGSSLKILYDKPVDAFKTLANEFDIKKVFTNRDYEPYSLKRDLEVKGFLNSKAIEFKDFKDHVIFEKKEITKEDGQPYTVFTPYSKKWKQKLLEKPLNENPSLYLNRNFYKTQPLNTGNLFVPGFDLTEFSFPQPDVSDLLISDYSKTRDYPSIRGTTRLGMHLRFGTISIRVLVKKAKILSEIFLNELIWRDFFIQILSNFPHVVNHSFKAKYDFVPWRNNENEFEFWCKGMTGFPLVDAGMRELNETGFMHNRIRMVTAGFLTKHLLIDWKWGEAYFAEKLLDYELASNNGNWQWSAGSGCDAAPYFRIFNPASQQMKFDKDEKYIRHWVNEYGTSKYPKPIIDHSFARERALKAYKSVL